MKLKDILDVLVDDLVAIYSFSEKREYHDGSVKEMDDNGRLVTLKGEKSDLNEVALARLEWYVCGLSSSIDGGIVVSVKPTRDENEIDYEEKYKRLIKSINRISQDFNFNQPLCLVVDHIDKDIVDDIAKIREEETKKHLKNFIEKCQEIKLIHLPSFESEEKKK